MLHLQRNETGMATAVKPLQHPAPAAADWLAMRQRLRPISCLLLLLLMAAASSSLPEPDGQLTDTENENTCGLIAEWHRLLRDL